jgi:GH25 family lysozyme M1 (1,4-beta-N-acetylmuramidase)
MQRSVTVVDISKYQQRINVQELQAGGVEHVILKAGGCISVDTLYKKHAETCLAQKMPISIYYWADPTFALTPQVDLLVSLAQLYPVSFIWIDVEQWWSVWAEWYKALQNKMAWSAVQRFRPDKLNEFYLGFVQTTAARVQRPVGVYTSYGFVTSYAPKMANWLPNYDLWVAHFLQTVPKGATMTWQRFLKQYAVKLAPWLPPGANPERVVGHQFTGDRIRLPGMYSLPSGPTLSGADVSLFNAEWLEKVTQRPWN